MLKDSGIKKLFKAFNNLESHDTWCIDLGPPEDGDGVQLVIVWDGETQFHSITRMWLRQARSRPPSVKILAPHECSAGSSVRCHDL